MNGDSRDEVLTLLHGRRGRRRPCFSGLISVAEAGLNSVGLRFGGVHADPEKMAAAASSSYLRFAYESAVVPLDMCVEAEALGVRVEFFEDSELPQFPAVARALAGSAEELRLEVPGDLVRRGRLPVVVEAIRRLKAGVGQDVVVGAWVPGPFTLATQLVALPGLMAGVVTGPQAIARLLDPLTDALAEVALAYRAAGADFITVHEMGGSPGVIGPAAFRDLVLSHLRRLLAALPAPRVLSACGRTTRFVSLLADCGADALSVDQTNDLATTRAALGPRALLFGNLDPIGTLATGDAAGVRAAVRRAIDAGADAVWPGCDLWPGIPAAAMAAMVDEAGRYTGRE